MMAQEMYEENKVLQAEVDGFRSLIEEVSNFLLTLNVTNSVEDREVGRLQELIRSICGDWELVSQSLPQINPIPFIDRLKTAYDKSKDKEIIWWE